MKTAEGQAEIRQRHRRLTQRQRTMLLLVDGRRSEAQVKALALQAGATDTSFDELVELGLIAAAPSAAPAAEETETAAAPADAADDAGTAAASAETPDDAGTAGAGAERHADADADPFEQFELEADRALEQQDAHTAPRAVDGVVSSLLPFIESAFGSLGPDALPITRDKPLEEARRILVRAVRNKAPLAGALTVAKLRRARSREELAALFDEVESHISKPMRHLSARQTLQHVRGLLFGDAVQEPDSPPA